MQKQACLSFVAVVKGHDAVNAQAFIHHTKALISSIGQFNRFSSVPYPKIPDSNKVTIEFDVALPFKNGLEAVVALIGGSGWHWMNEGDEKEAIWADGEGLHRPLGDYFLWGHVQLIPFEQLKTTTKRPRLEG